MMNTQRGRMVSLLVVLLHLVGLSGLVQPSVVRSAVMAAPQTAASTNTIALPGGCIKVTPGNGAIPTCCISGYVWMEGQAVRGATVTITAPNGQSQTLITEVYPDDGDQPYYRTALSGAPLDVRVGDRLTITARYSSHERTVTHVVQSGGQQVDVVLSRNSAQDYMFDRQTVGQPEEGKFNNPVSIDHDSSGNLYILDSENSNIQKFDRWGNFILQWGGRGVKVGEFSFPSRLTVDRTDAVYVLDGHRVQKFSSAGRFILQIGFHTQENPSTANPPFSNPTDVVVDQQGIVYVSDGQAIHKFASDGTYLLSWFTPVEQVHSLGIETTGNIVAFTYEPSISVYSPDGTLVRSWSTPSYRSPNGEIFYSFAHDIAIGPNNEVYLSYGSNLLDVYTATGQYIRTIGEIVADPSDEEQRYFISATLNIDNTIFILDVVSLERQNIRVRQYSSAGSLLSSWGSKGRGGQLYAPSKVWVVGDTFVVFDAANRLEIFTSQGERIRSIPLSSFVTTDIEVDSIGNVYVLMQPTASEGIVIRKLNEHGEELQTWKGFANAYQITRGPGDTLYVLNQQWGTDYVEHQWIVQIDTNGVTLSEWVLPSLPENQYGYGYLAVDPHGIMYIAYGGGIYKFSSTGNLLSSWEVGNTVVGMIANTNEIVVVTANPYNGDDYNVLKFSAQGTHLGSWGKYGYDVGELGITLGKFAPSSTPAVDGQGHIYIADVGNNRVQVFRPMTYTRPVATIAWLNQRSLVQGQDTLTLQGKGHDSDEDGAPGAFTYRWYRSNTLLGTGATLQLAASSLPVGTYDISLEVVDDEGEVSPRVSTTIDVSPPPRTAWTFMLYLVADSSADGKELMDVMDRGFGKGLLARLQDQQRATPNPNVEVVVQIDAYGHGNTRRLVLEPNGDFREVWRSEKAMDDPDTLEDFVRWARQTKTAEQYYLAIASHGNGYQGVAWDDTSGQNKYLTMGEIGQALRNASGDGAAPLDVLHLDACSMGLLDVAYELHENVRYLVLSQNIGWSFFLQDRYRAQTGANTTPRQFAENIVNTYADHTTRESLATNSRDQFPYTTALLDLRRVTPTVRELDVLARELGAYAESGSANQGVLAYIRERSQKFDSQVFDFHLTNTDEYVDLVDWAEHLRDSDQLNNPAIVQRANNVIAAVQGDDNPTTDNDQPLVVVQRNSGSSYKMPQRYEGRTTDLSGAHGVSVYYPHERSPSVPTVIWDRYKNDQLFRLTADTQWNEFLRAGNVALPSPGTPLPEPGKPSVPFYTPVEQLFIPMARR